MVGDAGYVRFFALLGGLTFVLLSLVSSGNLFWLFVCWHLVTWLLARLLVCNPDSRAARDAGQKTFWVQSFGDAAFAVALLVLYGSCLLYTSELSGPVDVGLVVEDRRHGGEAIT